MGGAEVELHSFLPQGDEWLISRSGRFTPGKQRRYPLNGGRVGKNMATTLVSILL